MLTYHEGDTPASEGVFEAVVHEVHEQPSEVLLIALNRHGGQRSEVQSHPTSIGQNLALLAYLCHQTGEVDRLVVHAQHPDIGTRQEQQSFHQTGNPGALLQSTRQHTTIFVRGSGRAQSALYLAMASPGHWMK